MGLEAYRIELRLLENAKRNIVLKRFNELGYNIMGKDFGSIYLAKAYEYGFIEIDMQNSELHRIALNEYMKNHGQESDIVKLPANDKERVIIQIAKPNHENIIDCLMNDVREFNKVIPINVINLQSKEQVDLNDYGNLKKNYIEVRNEFKKYYPKPSYPIRCRDVFKFAD